MKYYVTIDWLEYYILKFIFDNWDVIIFFIILIFIVDYFINKIIKRGEK